MPITKLTPENNYPYLDDRLKALEQAVPEAFADGKVNWDTLREVLGEDLEEGGCEEYFGLNWPGKREARKRASISSRGTLVPAPGEGVNEDETENLFIEGDNLEVLKLLQKSYAGRIKMIYIDPPYNTGNDFIYNDNFTDPLEAYLEYTGSKGEGGELLTTNTRADGRFHSKWLSMMYPRLIQARHLLRDDGVIFVSIDDNEVHNLRQVMNEIFGEENFEGHIHWRRRHNQPNDPTKMIALVAEHILSFAKSSKKLKESGVGKVGLTGNFSNPDNDPRGGWASKPWKVGSGQSGSSYTITTPTGKTYTEEWMGDEDTYQELLTDKRIYFPNNGDGFPRKKYFEFEREKEGQCATNWWSHDLFGHNQQGSAELEDYFNEKQIFSNPKPTKLIENLIMIANVKSGDIVMDFFAGSSSTADAVLQMNSEENLEIRFIMIQLPEKSYHGNYSTISEIGKERIRRVITKLSDQKSEENDNYPLLVDEQQMVDLGFRVFKYTHSNFKHWQPEEEIIDEVATLFDDLSDPLIEGWQKEDLLTEILLLEGFPLNSQITLLDEMVQNEVYQMSAPDFCDHKLFVCLDDAIQPNTIDLLELEKDDIFICLDGALTDELKARVQDKFNVHVF